MSVSYDAVIRREPFLVQLGEQGGGALTSCSEKAARALKKAAKAACWVGRSIYNTKGIKSIRNTVSYYCQERPYVGRPLKDWGKVAAVYTQSILAGSLVGCGAGGMVGLFASTGNVPITFCTATVGAFFGAGIGVIDAMRTVSDKEKLGDIGKKITYQQFILNRAEQYKEQQLELVEQQKSELKAKQTESLVEPRLLSNSKRQPVTSKTAQ